MRDSINTRSLILGAVAALLLAVAVPSTTLAQGKGRGRGHGNGDWSNRVEHSRSNRDWRDSIGRNRNYNRHYDKKCGKFVNCHDARNGRWDGRGPRRNRLGNVVWRNRLRNRTNTNDFWRNRTRRNYRRVTDNR
jgi:hypothetical protein